VPDLTTSAIERFFDRIDGALFVADRVLGRAHESVRRSRGSASSTVVVVPRFRVVEATNVQTGMPVFVATDETTRAECRTTEATDRVRDPYGSAVQGRTRHLRAQHLGSPSRRQCTTSYRRCCPEYGHGTEGDHAAGSAQLTPHAVTPSSCSAGERTK
jgi:hypothetical protein